MPVAGDDLGRHRRHLETQLRQGGLFNPGVDRGMGAHRAGQLAYPDVFPHCDQPLAVAIELIQPAGEDEAKAHRFGMDAVGPPGHQGPALLDRPAPDHGQKPIDIVEKDVGGLHQLQRERRVEDVGGGQAPVQIAGIVSHRFGQ